MENIIKTIEDLSLNAWPSYQMELYDGWILRFSHFYTHRTNSVEQFGTSTLAWRDKVPYCEAAYQRWGTPTIFKISPLVSRDFDYVLENRNYMIQHTTNVMTLNLNEANLLEYTDMVSMSYTIDSTWIDRLLIFNGTTNEMHKKIVPMMYNAIPKDTICVSIKDTYGTIIATGLGILDRDYVGVYAIRVQQEYRKRGMARAICSCILNEAKRKGISKAYLQVVAGNDPAYALYQSLGFKSLYTYWFRVSQ